MRRGYVAEHPPELQYATKELARDVSNPTERSELALKRVCRFLLGSVRCMWSFPGENAPTTLRGYSKTVWAGSLRTRRPTSCSVIVQGQRLIRSSWTQKVVALSSGESEYNGLNIALHTVERQSDPASCLQQMSKKNTQSHCHETYSNATDGECSKPHRFCQWNTDRIPTTTA